MKKGLLLSFGFFLVFSNVVSARSTETTTESITGSKIELQKNGLSSEDADYYARLDSMVKQMEKEKIEVDVADAPDLPKNFTITNENQLRKKILNKDKSALKEALRSEINLRATGPADLEKQLKEDIKNNISRESYTITYPDGSTISFSSGIKKIGELTNIVDTTKKQTKVHSNSIQNINASNDNTPNISGPWNEVTRMGFTANYAKNGAGIYTSTVTWTYSSPAGYSKVSDNFTWKFKPDKRWECDKETSTCNWAYYNTVERISDTGSSSGLGVVIVDNENLSNMGWRTTAGLYESIQGYTDVRFKVSGSFSASFLKLSIGVNAGNSWHQYAIQEVDGFSHITSYAGQFK